ncbi:hypothetical protein [Marinobacterium sedimentorum]|uniref:hypothetical protein n=1 Tax=Marinobacterium sedimentorum TaxID=2927804 RepID=UPI0020C709DE|nr:hypothetical protein [Marinobacterium sedimentorum]MCP8687139.1 hypothetical protein [Marinobacterium sedimentorum]
MAVFAKRYLRYREEPYGKRDPLLWPVYVYRVTYPAVRGRQLNLFQRAVIGLSRAGCLDPQEMSQLLGLHLQMILLILAQCNSNGWLDGLGKPTESGISLLEEDEDRHLELRSGLLFRDALNGAFWPRIVGDLEEMEPLPGSGEFPVFRVSRSTGKSLRPYVLLPSQPVNSQLDNREVLEAYRAYRLDYFNAKQLYGGESLPEQVEAFGIQLMEETPEPMYVLTWVAEDASGERPWRLCDPFDLRQQVPWLEGPFTELLPRNPLLIKKLARITGEPEPERQSAEEWMQSMDRSIDLELLVEHAWASREALIARQYTTLKRRLIIIEQGLGKYELESTLNDAQKLCEAVCQWILKKFRADVGLFPGIKGHDRGLNESLLEALELSALTPRVVRILAGQNLRLVLRVLEGQSQSLKAMLFGALLSTLNDSSHPLRKIAPEKLALDQVLELADLRNDAAHASGKDFEQGKVVQLGEFALNWTLLFKDWM